MKQKISTFALLFAVFTLVLVPVAFGQEDRSPAVPVFQGPPGARPLAMGGAFIGVADDATAAEANPAGLTILTRPEISLHLTTQDSSDLCEFCSAESSVHPTFASYVQPWKSGVFSVYYSSSLNSTTGYDEAAGIEFFRAREEANFRKLGVAAGFRPFPLLAIGAAVALSRLSIDGTADGLFDVDFEDQAGNQFPGLFEIQDSFESEENSFTYNLGVLLNPGGRFSVGAVYKNDDEFDGEQTLRDRGCLSPCTPAALAGQTLNVETSAFKVPVSDFLGAGLAVRPFPRTLFALDYTIQTSRAANISTGEQEIHAWHLGGEYVFATRNPNVYIPIRAGYAREKNPDYETSDYFREEGTTTSFGVGLVFGPNQLDIAYSNGSNLATSTDPNRADEKIRQVVVSGIRRF